MLFLLRASRVSVSVSFYINPLRLPSLITCFRNLEQRVQKKERKSDSLFLSAAAQGFFKKKKKETKISTAVKFILFSFYYNGSFFLKRKGHLWLDQQGDQRQRILSWCITRSCCAQGKKRCWCHGEENRGGGWQVYREDFLGSRSSYWILQTRECCWGNRWGWITCFPLEETLRDHYLILLIKFDYYIMFYGTKRRIDGCMCVVGVVLMRWPHWLSVCVLWHV